MLQTVQVWKRLTALQTKLGRYKAGFKTGAIASLLVLALGMTACGGGSRLSETGATVIKRMSEVSPPAVVQALATINESQPSVSIVAPLTDAVIDSDDVLVRFSVKNVDLYQDEELELGPHLNVLVDNEFYGTVYDTTSALALEGLSPGTHMIRAIASSAWDESFKNPEAYAQTTFHVFTKTPLTAPPDELPLLTYSQPTNSYGAEPILLDYYFTPGTSPTPSSVTPPTEEGQDSITQGWQVRATVNGEPFVFDQWEPIYLKGFKPGQNWVQIELLDDNQQPIESLFNNTARIIQYEPGGDDTLSRLMRDEMSIEEVGTLVDPNYTPPAPDIEEPEALEDLDESKETIVDESVVEDRLDTEQALPIESSESIIEDQNESGSDLDIAEPEDIDPSARQELDVVADEDLESDNENIEGADSDAIAPSESSESSQPIETPLTQSDEAISPLDDQVFLEDSASDTASDNIGEPYDVGSDESIDAVDSLEAVSPDSTATIENTEEEDISVPDDSFLLEPNSESDSALDEDLSSPMESMPLPEMQPE